MTFSPNEKVLIFCPRHQLHGRLARVIDTNTDREENKVYKLDVSTEGCDIWFSGIYLRKTRYLGVTRAPKKEDCIRVVDVKGIYSDYSIVGSCGELSYVDGLHACFGEEGDVGYVQLGDYEMVPHKKTAWVIRSKRIYRESVTRVSGDDKKQITWLTEDGYIIKDSIVCDNIVQALDVARSKHNNKERNIKVIYD